jgi:integrase
MTTIRSFFNWLMDRKVVRENPVAGVKMAKLDQKGREKFCEPELRDKLIAECENEEMRFILYCGFHAGMRKNEIIEARPEWFDLKAGSVTIRKTASFRPKDRQERTVPLTAAFKAFLATYGLRKPFMIAPKVEQGRARYRYDFRKPFIDYTVAKKCRWVTPHVMRHTFASLLASAGVSIYKVALWLGDEVRTTQKHYAKLLPKDDDIEKAF